MLLYQVLPKYTNKLYVSGCKTFGLKLRFFPIHQSMLSTSLVMWAFNSSKHNSIALNICISYTCNHNEEDTTMLSAKKQT